MRRWLAGSLFLLVACSSAERTPTVASPAQAPPSVGVTASAATPAAADDGEWDPVDVRVIH